MTRALRTSIVLLVLTNLGFVAITEGASWSWLGPLFVLTAFHPVLTRYTSRLWYRAIWNTALLGVFGLLVNNAVNVGPAHLLGDGLLLAALCQVHLLNNLRPNQKPDLVFFNSFLIAVVTSFLSIDLEYSLLFLVYAPLFVVGLQFLALSKMRLAMPTRRVVWVGLGRAVAVLAVTMVVFSVWPRDFHRRGLLGDRLRRLGAGQDAAQVDFSDRVDLDQTGHATASERVVMKVRGVRARIPSYWRGATQDGFDGSAWRPSRGIWYRGMEAWRPVGAHSWALRGRTIVEPVEVTLVRPFTGRLFLPLEARRVDMVTPPAYLRFQPLPDRTFQYPRYGLALTYRVKTRLRPRRRRGRIPPVLPGQLLPYVSFRRSTVPGTLIQFAGQIRANFPKNVEQHEFVEAVRAFLSTRYRYLPPGADSGAGSLMEFMSGEKGGHCEYFATALVLMLRSQAVPSRLVTGYRSEDYNDVSETLSVRAKHAHAWAEVLDPRAGWYTVDPSPVLDESYVASSVGIWGRFRRVAEGVWAKITAFDEETRAALMAWFSSLPRKLLWPAVVVILFGLVLRVARRRRLPVAVRAFHRAVKKQKVEIRPGETPRMLAARVPELAAAADAHEAARYAAALTQ